MALNAYLTMAGKQQGPIVGSVTQKGRENSILIHAYNHSVVSPRDPSSGLATGKRMHQPMVILKEVDKSSPRLWTALASNEVLIKWELQFWMAGPKMPAIETQFYTIRLTNASIASIEESMVDNEDPANAKLPLRERVSFTYQKIEWLWTDGQIDATDDWEVPQV